MTNAASQDDESIKEPTPGSILTPISKGKTLVISIDLDHNESQVSIPFLSIGEKEVVSVPPIEGDEECRVLPHGDEEDDDPHILLREGVRSLWRCSHIYLSQTPILCRK